MSPAMPQLDVGHQRRGHKSAASQLSNRRTLLVGCIAVLLAAFSNVEPACAATLIDTKDCTILRSWDRYKFIPGVPQDCASQPCSEFMYAVCDPAGRVVELNLYNRSLIGLLPDNLSGLTKLTKLSLAANRLQGPLPASWGRLNQLQTLHMYDNKLTGELPAEWSTMAALKDLNLARNGLGGALPSAWGALTSLTYLDLNSNAFAGGFPVSWGSLANLKELYLYNNSFAEPLPESWATLKRLEKLYIYDTNCGGTLPGWLGSLTKLTAWNLQNNNMGGTLPGNWSTLVNTVSIGLGNNQITGPLPPTWSSLRSLQEMGLENNQLTGTLPKEWGNLTQLTKLILSGNDISGAVPESWGSMVKLKTLWLNGTRLSGTLPTRWKANSFTNSQLSDYMCGEGTTTTTCVPVPTGTGGGAALPGAASGGGGSGSYSDRGLDKNGTSGPPQKKKKSKVALAAGAAAGGAVLLLVAVVVALCIVRRRLGGLRQLKPQPMLPVSIDRSKDIAMSLASLPGPTPPPPGPTPAPGATKFGVPPVPPESGISPGGAAHLAAGGLAVGVLHAMFPAGAAAPAAGGPGIGGHAAPGIGAPGSIGAPGAGGPGVGGPADAMAGREQRLTGSMPVRDSAGSLWNSSIAGPMNSSQDLLQSRQSDGTRSVAGSSIATDGPVLGKSVAMMLPLCLHLGFQIIESCMRVVCNNQRCNQLVARISALQPLLNHLQEQYGPRGGADGVISPREKEALAPVLQNIHDVFADVLVTINSWCSPGRFGSVATVLRNMATASWFQESFVELNMRLSGAFQDLTTAMHIQDHSARQIDRQTVLEETQQQTKEDLHGLVEQLATVGDDGRDGWETLTLEDRQKLASIFAHHKLDLTPVVKTARKEALEQSASKMLIPWQEISKARMIGKGGYGAVYWGTWKRTTKVALKWLDVGPLTDRDKADVLREAFIHHRAQNHPNIIPLYGITVSEQNECMLVMELASGDMQKLVSDMEVVLTIKRMYELALEVAQGMDHLHSKGIVHGDLKPSNVLVRDSGALAVSDFGLSSINCVSLSASISAARYKLDSESTALTICYSPPEFLSARTTKKTPAGDVFAFAMLLLEIFTGEMPYAGLPREAVMRTVLSGSRPPIPSRVPGPCSQIIVQCWHQDPACRPSFPEICDWLQQLHESAE